MSVENISYSLLGNSAAKCNCIVMEDKGKFKGFGILKTDSYGFLKGDLVICYKDLIDSYGFFIKAKNRVSESDLKPYVWVVRSDIQFLPFWQGVMTSIFWPNKKIING